MAAWFADATVSGEVDYKAVFFGDLFAGQAGFFEERGDVADLAFFFVVAFVDALQTTGFAVRGY